MKSLRLRTYASAFFSLALFPGEVRSVHAKKPSRISGGFQCLWLFDFKPGHQPVKLLPCDGFDLAFVPGPAVSALHDVKALVEKHKTVPLPQQDFDAVTTLAAKQIYGAGVRFRLKLLHDHGTQSID